MSVPLRVLVIEDSEEDTRLLLRELRRGGYEVSSLRVDTPAAMEAALDEGSWDVILSEHSMPFFGAPAALELLRSRGLDLPFIVVSGGIGEERAVAAVRAGAHDYVSKDNLARLIPAVARELREAQTRRERKKAEEALRYQLDFTNATMNSLGESVCALNREGRITFLNPSAERMLGWSEAELLGKYVHEILHSQHADSTSTEKCPLLGVMTGNEVSSDEDVFTRKDGKTFPVSYTLSPIVKDQEIIGAVLAFRDITERKKAEEALHASENRFRALIENSSDAIVLLAPDTTILYATDSVCQILGYTPGEFVGRQGHGFIHPEDRELAHSRLAELVREPDKTLAIEVRMWHSDGSLRWVEIVGANLLADPSVGAIVVNARDVTERKEAEEKLRRSEERFRRVVEQAADALFVHDLTGTFVDVNRQACESLGYTREELLSMSVPDIEMDFTPGALEKVWKKVSSGTPLTLVGTHRRKDGATFPVELRLGVFESEGCRLMLALARNVTERQQAEEALRESEQRFRSLVRNASDIITVLGPDGAVLYQSPATERALGYWPEQMVGKNLFDYVHPEDLEHLSDVLEEVRGDWDVQANTELRFQHADGSWRHLEVVANNLLDDPSVGGIVLNSRDITERNRAEEALRNNLGMLLALYEASQVLISTPGLKQTGVRLLEIMRWVSGLTAAILNLRDERGRLQAWEATGPEEVWGPAHDTPEAQAARRSVLEEGGTQVFHPQQSDPEAPPVGLCLPLLARGRIIGTLEAFGPESLVEKETLEILNSLASLAGSALENARLYGELAEREKQLENLVGKLLATQEDERRRVAYEVHDGLAQMAATAHQRLQSFARRNSPSSEKSQQDLDRVLKLVRQTVGEARRIIANLRPEVLDDFGLAVALRQEVDELRDEGWQVEYEEELCDERLPVPVETTLFRVAQEALTNVRKHAQTQRARLELRRREGAVSLKIRDWGRGFDPDEALGNGDGPGQRVGISGMRERIGLLGGEFEICSHLGEGTSISIWVPLPALEEDDQEDKHHGR